MPRWVDCKRATFKYGLGDEFINILKVLHTLGLDRTEKVRVKGVEVSPRDVVAAVLPDPATVGPRMTGKTCAGLWVTGTGKDGQPRSTYLYHVVDNEWTMQEYGHQCVVWQTAINPVVALELLATGTWSGAGVLGPEAFDALPFLDLLTEYGSPVGDQEEHDRRDRAEAATLVTEIPGPESRARLERKKAARRRRGRHDAAGVRHRGRRRRAASTSTATRLIDLGSGIAVTTVGNARRAVVAPGARAGRRLHPHLLHGHAVRRLRRRVRDARRADAGRPRRRSRRCSTPAPRRSRTPSRSPAWRTGRDAVGVFDHAYHGRTNLTMAMTAKNMPYKQGFGPFAGEVYRAPMSYPLRDGLTGERGRGPGDRPPRQAGRCRQPGLPGDRADPRRGRLRRARRRASCRRSPRGAATTASSSSPTRSSPASAAPATGSPATHEGVVPDLVTTAKGIAGGLPLAAVTGRAELMDSVHAGGLGGTYGGNPVACAAALGAIEEMRDARPGRPGPRDRRHHARRGSRRCGRAHPVIADVRGRGAMMAIELVRAGHHRAGRRPDRRASARPATGRASSP